MEIQGTVERVVFVNEENQFTVLKLKTKDRIDPVVVVGVMPRITPGEEAAFEGKFNQHPKYGMNFEAEHCRVVLPSSQSAIQKYLASGMIKGIGPVMAERLVEKFGEDTLDVIENHPEKLESISGIGEWRADMIRDSWDSQRNFREVMLFLHECGISPAYAVKIYKRYQSNAPNIVRKAPYRLAIDIWGIGFKTADRIAQNVGIPHESIERIQAGLIHLLNDYAGEGNVFAPKKILVERAIEFLDVREELIEKGIERTLLEGNVVLESFDEIGTAVFLKGYHISERFIAARLVELLKTPRPKCEIDIEKTIDWVEKQRQLKLAENQREAIHEAIRSKVLVITGGPGTGKTTIIQCILDIFKKQKFRIHLAAPTGRAAKRMSEVTRHTATTLHRLLRYDMQKGGFTINNKNPLDTDMLIIDEVSMIDVLLMHHVLKGIENHASLILVGDVDQLPSVGPGNVLRDIINSERVPVAQLNQIFRQARQSLIIRNAHRINEGKFPYIPEDQRAQKSDFYLIEKEEPDDILSIIKTLVSERIPNSFEIPPEQIQILSPMRRGSLGTVNLNILMQQALNSGRSGLKFGAFTYKPGDRVIQLKNNYELDIYNGDIGYVVDIMEEDRQVIVDFDGREVELNSGDMNELSLAYAITIHKSQGSEYPAVVIPFSTQHYVMLKRNLIYTAITRAKKLVVLVGTRKAVSLAVNRLDQAKRLTALAWRLKEPTDVPDEERSFVQEPLL